MLSSTGSYGVAHADAFLLPSCMLGGLVALIAIVTGIVFFATSHLLRGTALVIVAALAAGYGLVSGRRRISARS